MTNIVPTVGRIVWFYERVEHDHHGAPGILTIGPQAGIVAGVFEAQFKYANNKAYLLTLSVCNPSSGVHRGVERVPLIQEGEKAPTLGPYCTWMPYQIGQAAQTEGVAKRVAALAERAEQSRAEMGNARDQLAQGSIAAMQAGAACADAASGKAGPNHPSGSATTRA